MTEVAEERVCGCLKQLRGLSDKGVFCVPPSRSASIATGTWMATFGPLWPCARQSTNNLNYSVWLDRECAEGRWSRVREHMTPMRGWERRFMGPRINHTCCVRHHNCVYVPSDCMDIMSGTTMNVRTTRVVPAGEEFLTHYGQRHHKIVGETCLCCACRGEKGCFKR